MSTILHKSAKDRYNYSYKRYYVLKLVGGFHRTAPWQNRLVAGRVSVPLNVDASAGTSAL